MSDRPRLELNTVQVIASAGAAVTGAVLTSYLGDGGTILGTAVGSVASTTGFAVYKHYLGRTKEVVAPVIVERARVWAPGTGNTTTVGHTGRPRQQETRQFGLWDPRERTGQQAAGPSGTAPGTTAPGTARGMRSSGPPDPWKPAGRAGEGDPAQTFGTVRVGDTVYGDPNGNGGRGSGGNGGPGRAGSDDGNGGHAPGGRLATLLHERPRWLVTAASAAAVFVAVMIVITVVELGTGKPISASVWGHQGSGTSIGGAVGGNQGGSTTTPTPTGTATPTTGATVPGQTQPSSGVSPSPSAVPPTSAPATGATTPATPNQGGAGNGAGGGANQDNGATPAP